MRNEKQKIDDKTKMVLDDLKLNMERLFEITQNIPEERMIIEMLFTTGLRVSEQLNIKKSDIEWALSKICIRGGKGYKIRFVYLSHECSERLMQYLSQYGNSESSFLFSNKNGKPRSQLTKL